MAAPTQFFDVIDQSKFEAIIPSQFITMTIQNSLTNRQWLHFPVLRVAVLDSPFAKPDDESPVIAAMIVPKNRETDWSFSESGHFQLLFKFKTVSRLILIGNAPPVHGPSIYKLPPVIDTKEKEELEEELKPLLKFYHPKKSSDDNELPETLFLTDEDDVAYRVTVAKFLSTGVGEYLVEDVELLGGSDRNKQIRRRLRFKSMPRVVQSQALIYPIVPFNEATTQTDLESLRGIEGTSFAVSTTDLVHDYMIPMASGLFLIASHLNGLIQYDIPHRALCLGVGGGALLNFLDATLGFEVTAVEIDRMVLSTAKFHFGLNRSKDMRLIVGDAIEIVQNFPHPTLEEYDSPSSEDFGPDLEVVANGKFDVIMVDLDSIDAKTGYTAPPPGFVKKPVFEGMRSLLDDHGVVIINVVPPNKLFYSTLVLELKEIFYKVYEIDVENLDNFIVMATVAPRSSIDDDNQFLKRLKSGIPGINMDSIVELCSNGMAA